MNQQPIKRRSFFASLAALPFLAFFGRKTEASLKHPPHFSKPFKSEGCLTNIPVWSTAPVPEVIASDSQQYPDDPIFNAILRVVERWNIDNPNTVITYRGYVLRGRYKISSKQSALAIYNEIMMTAIDCCGGSDYSMQINEHGFAEYMANSAVYHGEDRQG